MNKYIVRIQNPEGLVAADFDMTTVPRIGELISERIGDSGVRHWRIDDVQYVIGDRSLRQIILHAHEEQK